MKKKLLMAVSIVVLVSGLGAAYAAPERITIQTPDQRAKELAVEDRARTIYLDDIEDPAARKAIQEVYNYLGLQTQK